MSAPIRAATCTALLASLLAIGCAHRSPAPRSPLEHAWKDAHSLTGTVVESKATLQQHLEALKRLIEARRQAEREAHCAAQPENERERCLWAELEFIEVTGSRIAASDLITNTQEAGIDEGGIVKKSGDHLLVLRQGTLYSIALREAGHDTLRVVDRLSAVEDDAGRGVWYDEILALDERVVLLGFGEGTQLIGFALDAAGRLRRDWHYTLSSIDYFSGNNYGMRLHGDRLVFKLSLILDWNWQPTWPSWRPGDDLVTVPRPLVEAGQILLPGLVSEDARLHLVLSCPLSELDAGRFDCETRGVLGEGRSELYVAESAAYLALPAWDEELHFDPRFDGRGWNPRLPLEQLEARRQTWLVRFPLLSSDPPALVRLRGSLLSQHWLKARDDRVHALTLERDGRQDRLRLHRIAPEQFSADPPGLVPPQASQSGSGFSLARLTDEAAFIVRGPELDSLELPSSLSAIDLAGSGEASIELDFWPSRLEPALGRLVVVGYSDATGLNFALLPDRSTPHLLDSLAIPGLEDSEGRSHAFNAGRLNGGRSLFGLPVVPASDPAEDASYWPERVSDLLLVDMSANRLRQLGLVDMASSAHPEPDCEHSCVDWYGNARVFFIGERIFALSADQLVELRLRGDSLQEVARIRLSD